MKGDLKFKLMEDNTPAINLTNENTICDMDGNKYIDPNRVPANFKGLWMSKEIISLNDIGDFDKMLLSEISGLATNGICFASNEYFSTLFNKDERTIQRSLSKLKDRGYIEEVGFDGRKRYLKSNVVTAIKNMR